MMLDIHYILRALSRARGFTIAVILTLGLGIGANTAIFSAVRGVLLRPLPHQDGDRLMYLRQSTAGPGTENILFSVPEIEDFRGSSKTLAQIAEYSPLTLNLVEENDASQVDVGLVTGNYFSVMGLKPIIGRQFNAADDGAGAAPVVMLTHQYWLSHFGGDSSIVGKTMRIGNRQAEVVGILQPAPFFPGRIDALMNMSISEHHVSAMMVQGRSHRMTEMIARLSPGATIEQARAEVDAIRSRIYVANPETYAAAAGYKVTLTPFKEVLGSDAKLTLWLLMGAAAFVLVIACANVANLTLMRGVRRESEMMVRAALGAGSARLRRLLLIENLMLALGGALLGLVIAWAGVGMISAFAARFTPRADEIRLDALVLAFAFLLAIFVAVLLSYAPRVGSESSLGAGLSAGATRAVGGVRRKRLQQGLVVTQITVSVILLTGAGLLVKSMLRLADVDTGLNAENVLTMEVPRDFVGPADNPKAIARYQEMQTQLSTLPGVEIVGVGSTMPLRSAQFQLEIKADGRPVSPNEPVPQSEYRTADPGYFKASGIPLIAGREFASTDHAGSARVVIINKTLADKLFPGQDAVGKRVAWTGDVLKFVGISGDWRTVVGVVGDTKDGGLDAPTLPVTFLPFAQGDFPSGGVVIRTAVDPAGLATAARSIVRSIAPEQPIENIMTVDDIRDESVGPRRLNAMLVGSFGLLALVIAAIGIAAVLAFSVSARTNEIGIRMSLGAAPGQVQRMVLLEGGLLVVLGLVGGVIGSLVLSRLMRGLLFGVEPNDPLTIILVGVVMTAIGVAACWIPAARASRIDPSLALRAQ
jgi:predicted permease